jgi:hypothetical protein
MNSTIPTMLLNFSSYIVSSYFHVLTGFFKFLLLLGKLCSFISSGLIKEVSDNKLVNADSGKQVKDGDEVSLTAERSFGINGDKLNYLWTQLEPTKPKVKLHDSDGVQTKFIAPEVDDGGTGFPAFLFNDTTLYPRDSSGAPKSPSARAWWTKWWNNTFNINGTDGRTLQANSPKKIVTV